MHILAITIVLLHTLCIVIPRRMSCAEIYASTIFVLYLQAVTDIYLNLKLNMYGYFGAGPDWISLVLIWGTYPALSYLILTTLRYCDGLAKKAVLVAVWSFVLLALEAAFLESGTLYYVTWELWYSAVSYPVIIAVMAGNLKLFRGMQRR